MTHAAYVLVTPARNEAATIGATIAAVAAQTVLPAKWVIVSDGSTDGTDAIIQQWLPRLPTLVYLRRDAGPHRDFGSKVYAILHAMQALEDTPHDFVGNLDGDITFEPGYFAALLEEFHQNPRLGIAGGVTFDVWNGKPRPRHASLQSVGGAVQLFRRQCYDDVGGYLPLPGGMEDSAAIYTAQYLGWECRSFPGLPALHHRPTGSGNGSILRARFRQGAAMQSLGWSPWWMIARTLHRVPEWPFLLGSLARAAGYFNALGQRRPHSLPPEIVAFIRKSQREQLHRLFGRPRRREGC